MVIVLAAIEIAIVVAAMLSDLHELSCLIYTSWVLRCSVVPDSLQPHGR